METAGRIDFKKMFGQYAFYCDGRVVALVCDNTLFVKTSVAGSVFADAGEAQPYPGAKNHLVNIDGPEVAYGIDYAYRKGPSCHKGQKSR